MDTNLFPNSLRYIHYKYTVFVWKFCLNKVILKVINNFTLLPSCSTFRTLYDRFLQIYKIILSFSEVWKILETSQMLIIKRIMECIAIKMNQEDLYILIKA
jgi:hypothetical protein